MEDTKEFLDSQTTTSWPDYVRSEVMALLDVYLPDAKNGNVGIRYKKPVLSLDEAGNVLAYDTTKAEAVSINIVFEFYNAVDISDQE